MEEVEKILRVLEVIHWQYLSVSRVLQVMILGPQEDSPHHHFFAHLPREAQRVGQKLASEGVGLDALTERVLQEAWMRMEAPLGALWEALGTYPRTEFAGNQISLRELKVWWRWEAAHIGNVSGWSWNVLEDNFLGELIRHGLVRGRQVLNAEGYPTRLRALIESLSETLNEGENPLALLNSDDLHSKIALRLLSWF